MVENSEAGLNNTQHGLSFEEAIKSNSEVWSARLTNENYDGNIADAATWLTKFTEGMAYAYKALSARNKIDQNKPLPRVDIDNLPEQFGVVFYRRLQYDCCATTMA
jgi:hypothetical protein